MSHRVMVLRPAALAAAMTVVVLAASCDRQTSRPHEVDLLMSLPAAEKRAGSDILTAVRPDVVTVAGDTRTALVLRVPARVTWPVVLPASAEFLTSIALLPESPPGVRIRVGMSDGRTYEDVARHDAVGAWQPLAVNLRTFSEWKFSVFYQPLRRSWRFVINAEGAAGALIALDRPRITRS